MASVLECSRVGERNGFNCWTRSDPDLAHWNFCRDLTPFKKDLRLSITKTQSLGDAEGVGAVGTKGKHMKRDGHIVRLLAGHA